jgi:DNA-binding FadR family transcriptional regulator
MTRCPGNEITKTAEFVAADLRRQIVTGQLKVGDKLHQERVLCEHWGVSRYTLRRALSLLERESLVRISRGPLGGVEITLLDIGVITKEVGLWLQMEGVCLGDVWHARALIEPTVASDAAAAGNKDLIAELAKNIGNSLLVSNDTAASAHLAAQFYEILFRYCECKTLRIMIIVIHDIIRLQQRELVESAYSAQGARTMLSLNIGAHEKLLDLIDQRDAPGAERFWRAHLVQAGSAINAYRAMTPINVLGA